jgi:hypothetical protein
VTPAALIEGRCCVIKSFKPSFKNSSVIILSSVGLCHAD